MKHTFPVFVSSTFSDLQPYRAAVREALHRLEAVVRGMEYFGATPETPKHECMRIVGSCRAYVGIFAMRYGSVDAETGKSFTHLEYEEAQRLRLPSLIYLIDEERQPVLPRNIDFSEIGEKLKALKNELRKRHVVSFFTTPEDLAVRVSQDLPALAQRMTNGIADSPGTLIHYAETGDELDSSALCGEFLFNSHDLVLWAESEDGPQDPVALFQHNDGSYARATSDLNGLIPYATRIRATAAGGMICIQERAGVSYVAPSLTAVTPGVRVPIDEDPIIRSEVVHPTEPIVVLGTDYGMLVAWDWVKNSVLFCKRYFPRSKIIWMDALAIDARNNLLLFVVSNVLYEVRITDGDLLRHQPLGPAEESGSIAFHARDGLLAVGGLMHTRLYRADGKAALLWEIQNPLPLVHQICFSPDGRLLAVLAGMNLGGTALMIIDVSAGRVVSRHAQVWPPKSMSVAQWMGLQMRGVSFSSTSDLLAIGEGGRVGIYRCPALK